MDMADHADQGVAEDTSVADHQALSTSLEAEISRTTGKTAEPDIRGEKEDLKLAAEQSFNTIIDLGLDGIIRWVSPSWVDVVGYPSESVKGVPIANLLLSEDKDAFATATESMKQRDHRSQIVRFQVELGPSSAIDRKIENEEDVRNDDDLQGGKADHKALDLEGQGIMVYDRSSGGESHVGSLCDHRTQSMLRLPRQCGWYGRHPDLEKSRLISQTS